MAIYYVDSTATGGSDTGGSWANAFLTFAQAVTAASTAGDFIYVSHAHSESLSADTTYTFAANVRVLCVNSSTGALATTAVIGAQSTNYSITFAGAYVYYIYGITLRNGTSSSTKVLVLSSTDGCHAEFENCKIELTGTNVSNSIRLSTLTSGGANDYVKLVGCTFKFSNAGQSISLYVGVADVVACSVDSSGTAPTALFTAGQSGQLTTLEACDLSFVTGTLIANHAGSGARAYLLINCKLGSGVTIMAAAGTVVNKGQTSVWAFNCNAGDNHYAMYHGDAFGETTVSNTVYANDGAAYDGTNKASWKIVTTANCNYYYPYVSPWIDCYHSGTSAITPYLEILRSGSTTNYQNDEVWGEFSYQGTSGSTKATLVNDRMTPLGSAADQAASSLDASGWTGEDATNNAYMKLESGSITPAEIGHLRARVCVGEPSITVYVDPTIRGRS
jgi:hypothetical protein